MLHHYPVPFDLETLGGLRLVGRDGQVVQTQRRRLALLALLAAAGERGLTRARLVGVLWSDASEENAKHALNQLLYGIRRALGDNAIGGLDPLRLDPTLIDSDVQRFERALAAGAHDDAVASYRGPFMDGFYLADAPAFERRVEAERSRLAGAYVGAVERLAVAAESRGELDGAVRWRRALAKLDPLDARCAMGLMRALAQAGDPPAALAFGRRHETLVRKELNSPPSRHVITLSNEIRASAGPCRSVYASSPAIPWAGGAPNEPDVQTTAPAAGEHGRSVPATAAADTRPRRRIDRGHRAALIAGGVLAAGAATFAIGRVTGERQRDSDRSGAAGAAGTAASVADIPSIAVLPLTHHGTDPRDAVLADGMTDDLTSILARMGRLRVIARQSASSFSNSTLDIRRIADTLGVGYLLEGNLEQANHRLRVQVRLIDGRDGTTRWSSELYDRDVGDLFAVRDDIAAAVARELDVRLADGRPGVTVRRYTPSLEAYRLYRRGMDVTFAGTAAGRRQGKDFFNSAIAADSNFAAAYAGLVGVYMADAGDAAGNSVQAFARAKDVALKAVALDDSLPEAHSALGWALSGQRQWPAALAAFKRAIAIDPTTPRAYEGLARAYLWTGMPAEQLVAARAGLEVDRLSHSAVRELALALLANRRCDEALQRLRPLKTRSPPLGVAGVIAGQCYATRGMWPEAIAEFQWALETSEARMALAFLGYALARDGQRDPARRILSDLVTGRKSSHGAFGIASVYAGLGETDSAFAYLEKAVDEHTVRVYIVGPMFADLQRDPRFAALRRRMGP